MKSRSLIPKPKKSPIISKICKKSGINPNLRIEVAIRANSLEAVDIVDQKKNTLMALQTAKQRMQSVKSVARRITLLSYVEAVTQPEKEVQVEVKVTKMDRLNLRV